MRRLDDTDRDAVCWLEGPRAGYVTGLVEPVVVSDPLFDRLLDHNAYKLLRHRTSDQYAVLTVSDEEEHRPSTVFLRASVLDDLPVFVVSSGFPVEGFTVDHASTSEARARQVFADRVAQISADVVGSDEVSRADGFEPDGYWPDEVVLCRWEDGVSTELVRQRWRGKELPVVTTNEEPR